MIGILFMLYGPTSFQLVRTRPASYAAPIGFTFEAPPPAPTPIGFFAEGSAPITPVANKYGLSTDFSVEEPVQELRIRGKAPSPPPLPAVTPLPPPPTTTSPAHQPPVRMEAAATPPRLGVSAPSARARHLEPPRRMPPPLPRSRSARGSDAPPPSFATENQRTLQRELDDFSTAEHTFVD